MLAGVSAFAQVDTIPATPANVEKMVQIVDIRTPAEWQETGVINGAKLVELVRDKDKFIQSLRESGVDFDKPVAFICRSGARSGYASQLIDSAELKVFNLDGGMNALISQGYITTPYTAKP